MVFFPNLRRIPLEDVITGFLDTASALDVPEEERPFWLEEAAIRIARSGPAGVALLISLISRVDESRLRAILLALSFVSKSVLQRNKAKLQKVLLPFLDDSRPLVVAQAIDTLSILDIADLIERVLPLRHHNSPYVVGSVLRFLRKNDPGQAEPILMEALDSSSSIVRQNAVDELEELKCVEALPRLRRLLDDRDESVRQAAQTAVANLEGKVIG